MMEHVFDPANPPDRVSALAVAQDLMDTRTTIEKVRNAIERRRICVAYQPIVKSTDFKKILAFEVMVRLYDEFDRIIPAEDFMYQIENEELGRVVDTEVLYMCLKKLNLNPRLMLSLNVSARSIGHPPWRIALADAVKRDPGIGKRLILEFTEDSVNKVPEFVTIFMREMSSTGIIFALDRFGSGLTAFHTFKKFMFDIVKFDSSITQGAMKCSDTEVMVNALIDFCHAFDMQVVIDRIESENQKDYFCRMRADFLQGYYFGKPRIQK